VETANLRVGVWVVSLGHHLVDKWVYAKAFLLAELMGALLAESTVSFEVHEMVVMSDVYAVESRVLLMVVLKVEMWDI